VTDEHRQRLDQELADLNARREFLEAGIGEATRARDAADAAHAATRSELDRAEARCADLLAQLAVGQREQDEAARGRDRASKAADQIRLQAKDLRADLAGSEERVAALQNQHSELVALLRGAEESRAREAEARLAAVADAEILRTQRDDLAERVTEVNARLERLQGSYEAACSREELLKLVQTEQPGLRLALEQALQRCTHLEQLILATPRADSAPNDEMTRSARRALQRADSALEASDELIATLSRQLDLESRERRRLQETISQREGEPTGTTRIPDSGGLRVHLDPPRRDMWIPDVAPVRR
jgi:hypothetical protein